MTINDRIESLDVLRGVAVLGILLMNIQSFAMPSDAYMNPTAWGDLHGLNGAVWLACHVLADQKCMSILSMLFGAGILLIAERSPDRATRVHYRRMAVLIVFGLLHAYVLWSGDILYTYGVCGLVVYLARRWSARRLIVAGIAVHAVSSIIFLAFGYSLHGAPPNVIADIRASFWQSSPADIAQELAAFRGGWLAQAPIRVQDSIVMQTFVLLIDSGWKAAGLMLVGMGLLKRGVLSLELTERAYQRMLTTGLAIGLPLIGFGVWSNVRAGWDVRYSLFFGYQFNYWGSVAVAIAWIAAVMLWCRSPRGGALRWRVAAVGRTAFSNYILQTVVCTTLFYGYGFGWFGYVSRVQQLLVVMVVWCLQLLVSPFWLRYFKLGPLEWLWRTLTYGRRQPMWRATLLTRIVVP